MDDANKMVAISLPKAEWGFLLEVFLNAPVGHQPRAKIVAAMQGQFKAIEERDREPDHFTGESANAAPNGAVPKPQPGRVNRRK